MINKSGHITYTAFFPFCGLGAGALGYKNASCRFENLTGNIEILGGIDCNKEACIDFERLTGVKATCLDLFTRKQYIAFNGKEPPLDWREATVDDVRRAAQYRTPDIVFTSPPCQGNSALLSEEVAKTPKYQALNELAYTGLKICLEAFQDDLPSFFIFENVARITKRSSQHLERIKRLFEQYGYIVPRKSDNFYDCGELGSLAQHRKRYLLVARNPKKVPTYLYQPKIYRVKAIGEVLDSLPIPDDTIKGGAMHRLQRLQWKTWVRLSLIPPGGDWRDLESYTYQSRNGTLRIVPWDSPSPTVNSATKGVGISNGPAAVADPRLNINSNGKANIYCVQDWSAPAMCVTGAVAPSNGATCISDPRLPKRNKRYPGLYKVCSLDEPAPTIIGQTDIQCGALSIADPRLGCKPRTGTMGVLSWDQPSYAIIGSSDVHAAATSVADPHIPLDKERPDPVPIIISKWGYWHRPLTTLELAVIQGLPTHYQDGTPLVLAGNSDARWRERIGNAVPPAAAQGIAETMLFSLLASFNGNVELGWSPIWVSPGNIYDVVVMQ